MNIPRYINIKLQAAFHNTTTDDGYPIHDEVLNNWLDKQFLPACGFEREEFNLNDTYVVWFDFAIGRWRVK